jgi:UPF0271 protein
VDINADLGEGCGDDDALLGIVTSASIACGGHAGDEASMRRTVRVARDKGVAIGAHPGYPDREHFGRRRLQMPLEEIARFTVQQTEALLEVAAQLGARVLYVKPHGALGNAAAEDAQVAAAIVRAARQLDASLGFLAMPRSALADAAAAEGAPVRMEIYADRAYDAAGMLVPRSQPGAVLDDSHIAIERLRNFIATGRMATAQGGSIALNAQSICVHGDNPHAVRFAHELRDMLAAGGLPVEPAWC